MKFTFIDKETLCTYEDGKVTKMDSTYVTQYRETSTRDQKNKEWKKNSDAMLYEDFFNSNGRVDVTIHALSPTTEPNKLVYAFSVNESSGIYFKYTDDEKKTEAHVVSSNEENYLDIVVTESGDIAGCVQQAPMTSSIAVFSKDGGDYKCLTGGDSKDEHPFFTPDGNILFNSYGVGRELNHEFVKYMPSEILKLNVRSMEIDTLLSDGKYSYVKPMLDGEGNLYCIKRPSEERSDGNVFVKILLVPVRIVEAIIGFVSMFVNIFAGKPLVDGKGRSNTGGGAARNADPKTVFVQNHMLNVEKELKRNQKEEDGGFIPRSFKLVKIPKNTDDFEAQYIPGMAVELASGVADYCLLEENGEKIFLYTNGKRIFKVNEKGERKKLVNTDFCIKLGALQKGAQEDDFFGRL